MREGTDRGPCAKCGKKGPGLYWRSTAIVLDFGVPDVAPMEPNMTVPVLCDDCEDARRLPELRKAGLA